MRVSIYLYILEQFVCGASLMLALGRAARVPRTPPLRLTVIALLGAWAAALAAVHPALPLRMALLTLTLLSPSALWPGLPRRLRRMLPLTLLTLLLLFAGVFRFLLTLPIPAPLALILACCLSPLMTRPAAQQFPPCATLEIRCGTARVTLTALIDTGNLLRDPVSSLPVIVIAPRAAQRLIPLPVPGRLNPGLRQIPIRTVAGSSVMTVFRPGQVRLRQDGAWQDVQAAVGIAPGGYNGVQALVPAALLHTSATIFTQGG